VLERLQELFAIVDYVVCQETHSDLGLHIHAFLKLERKINKRTSDFADLTGFKEDGTPYHPNITAPRSIKAVIKYVEKVSGLD
jgi:hypothetical protein